jgi:gamma-glutamyltranspeptidase/glutathione hydrolase
MAEKFSVIARNGMVASSQPLATLAGVQVLMNDGNAIDAAIATAGGVGRSRAFVDWHWQWMRSVSFIRRKKKKIKALDASGRSPYGATLEFCRNRGFYRNAAARHSLGYGSRRCARLGNLVEFFWHEKTCRCAARGDRLCREGFPVAELTAEQWKESEARLKADQGAATNYLINGRTPKGRRDLRNPRMAVALKRVAAEGPDCF